MIQWKKNVYIKQNNWRVRSREYIRTPYVNKWLLSNSFISRRLTEKNTFAVYATWKQKYIRTKKWWYPIFVDWPIVTAGPIIAPDPIWTFAPKRDFEWTTAPSSTSAVGSMQADLWKVPPPLCHFRNSWWLAPYSSSNLEDNHV